MFNVSIIELKGGLGNQLFQAAFSEYLKKHFSKHKVYLDRSFYNNQGDATPRNLDSFVSNSFSILNMPRLFKSVLKNNDRIIYEEDFKDIHSFTKVRSINYFSGYWQSYRYVESSLPTMRNLLNQSYTRDSIALHVRRGDYVSSPSANAHHGVLNPTYYTKSLNYMKKISHIRNVEVYSDDISWVKKNIYHADFDFIFQENRTALDDMVHMSECSHFIIANSTFSWWSAVLGNNDSKTVISPKNWFAEKNEDEQNLILPNWIRMSQE